MGQGYKFSQSETINSKSRWTGLFTVHEVFTNEAVELLNSKDDRVFKVNGQRLKAYTFSFIADKEELPLLEPLEV